MSVTLIDVHFVRLRTFERTAKGLLSDDDERQIEKDIAENPEAAPIIMATGGVRKIRGRLAQHGKRGGVRVLYLYVAATETVYLLTNGNPDHEQFLDRGDYYEEGWQDQEQEESNHGNLDGSSHHRGTG